MAHKVNIGGTAYEIDGGKAMVDGAVYEIDHGTTLVGGTVYEVGFDDGMRKVAIRQVTTQSTAKTGVEVNGQTYIQPLSETVEIIVPIGTLVRCFAPPAPAKASYVYKGTNVPAMDFVFGATVLATAEKGSASPAEYTHEVTCDTIFSFGHIWVYITELPEGQIAFTVSRDGYFADEGMTWGEWVNSGYNPERSGGIRVYEVKDNMIYNIEEGLYVCLPSNHYEFPNPTTPIVANGAYTLTKD